MVNGLFPANGRFNVDIWLSLLLLSLSLCLSVSGILDSRTRPGECFFVTHRATLRSAGFLFEFSAPRRLLSRASAETLSQKLGGGFANFSHIFAVLGSFPQLVKGELAVSTLIVDEMNDPGHLNSSRSSIPLLSSPLKFHLE